MNQNNRYIFYLVTKPFFYFKPLYSALENSLKELRKQCTEFKVDSLAMPKIGAGLDQLDWSLVELIIHDVFNGSNINIEVYEYVPQPRREREEGGEGFKKSTRDNRQPNEARREKRTSGAGSNANNAERK